MKRSSNIFLIGPMGSGKSSVGEELSNQLKMDFYDSDKEIEKYYGVDINDIFNREGEVGFRKIEEIIIDQITKRKGIILSTGGGTITSKKNRHILILRGFVIYLQVSINQQLVRTKHDIDRPLLHDIKKNNKNVDILKKLYKERNNIYHNMANYMIHTGGVNIHQIVLDISNHINRYII